MSPSILMSCSIIIPTYNRKKFSRLISQNIRIQTYPNILEVIVADDGDESQRLELDVPYPVQYVRCERMSIGKKRNLLASIAKGHFIAHMDTDDVYLSSYITSSINLLKNKEVTGTSDMFFLFKDGYTGAMRNLLLSMANEATLVYTKRFWERGNFGTEMSSEGIPFLKGRHWEINHSNIQEVMVCLCHEENTVDKEVWRKDQVIDIPPLPDHELILIELGFVRKERYEMR